MANRQTTLEFLTTTRIGEKGQLTVPKEFREDLGLGMGAPFVVLRLGDGLVLLPEQQRFENLCKRVSAALTGAGFRPKLFWQLYLKLENAFSTAITARRGPPSVHLAEFREIRR